jgi:hypothetical protein
MRPLKLFSILTAITTVGYVVSRLFKRRHVTHIPVEEVR